MPPVILEWFPQLLHSVKDQKERNSFQNKRQLEDTCQTPEVHISFDLAWPFQLGSKQLILMVIKIKKKISEFIMGILKYVRQNLRPNWE